MTGSVQIGEALIHPEKVSDLNATQWDLIVRQGRRANLLSRLACLLMDHGRFESVIEPAKPHLQSARALAERQDIALRWEVRCIQEAIAPAGVPIILLKGAAYVIAGLPPARGRIFSDVDILVPKASIPAVESALMLKGWGTTHLDPYDQRYYRRWMHEIPPMMHVRRGTAIDVHHAILPETARIRCDSETMRRAAIPVAGHPDLFVLAPCDMVLHSATHLFHEGELDNGLRDLVDIDSLLRHFGEQPGFWDRLVPRAQEVGLTRPLFYALRYVSEVLETPVPAKVLEAADVGGPRQPLRALMDFLYRRALRPNHPTCSDRWTPLARWLLYVRSHWLRMPFPLLAYHLARKALVREGQAKETDRPAKQA